MQTQVAPTAKSVSNVQKAPFKVYHTSNYDLFKIMGDNRTINLLHVKRLVESFKENHLICPIIVNEKYEVIDGQHRLAASKETGMPVYYLQIEGYGINEVSILNTNQKNWSKLDFLEMYCSQGAKAYLEFREFMNSFPDLGFQACERLLTGLSKGRKDGYVGGKKAEMKDFQEGKLVIPNITKSYSNARKLMDFKDHYDGFNRGIFVSAVMPLFKSKNYDHKEMVYKLGVSPKKLRHCPNVEQYRLLLEDIYNWKRQKENKVSFRYE